MRYMVIYKCTRSERDGIGLADPPDEMNCYMVANKPFFSMEEARNYANGVATSRQPRIAELVEYKCPAGGDWRKVT